MQRAVRPKQRLGHGATRSAVMANQNTIFVCMLCDCFKSRRRLEANRTGTGHRTPECPLSDTHI